MNTIKKMNRTCKLALIISFTLIAILAVQILPAVFNESNAEAGDRYVPWNADRHMYTPDKHQRAALRIDQNFWDQVYKTLADCASSEERNSRVITPEISWWEKDDNGYIATHNGQRDKYKYTNNNTDSDDFYVTDIAPCVYLYDMSTSYDKKMNMYFSVDYEYHCICEGYSPWARQEPNYSRFTLMFCSDDGDWWAMTNNMHSDYAFGSDNGLGHVQVWGEGDGRNWGWHDTWVKGADGKEIKKDNDGKGKSPVFYSDDGKTLKCDDTDYAQFIGKTGWLYIKYVFDNNEDEDI